MGPVARFIQNCIKAKEVLWARYALRRCTSLGALIRLRGRIIVENGGTLIMGKRVQLRGKQVPIELVTLSNAELVIGDVTSINNGVSICAQKSIRIGKHCGIGNYTVIYDTDFHVVGGQSAVGVAEGEPVVIGDNVWIASHCVILKGVTIGEGAVVCAGAVVRSDVAPYTMVGGVPAKEIGTIDRSVFSPEAAESHTALDAHMKRLEATSPPS